MAPSHITGRSKGCLAHEYVTGRTVLEPKFHDVALIIPDEGLVVP